MTGRLIRNLSALFVFAVSVFPVYWMVLTAFKPTREIQAETPTFWPSGTRNEIGTD